MPFHKIDHPLADHLLTGLRDENTPSATFRRYSHQLSAILALEATQDLERGLRTIRTPIEAMDGPVLKQGLTVIPVLRAGLSMQEPILELFPEVSVGYVGLERDHETAVASRYYMKLPPLSGRCVLCLDPMLATGGSASQAITLLKKNGADLIKMICVVASPEGVARMDRDHPEVNIYGAALDRELDANSYICPGLGDFGDRLYGTL